MPGPKFFETGYGKRFFEGQLPELIKNIGRIATAMEKSAMPRIVGELELHRSIKLSPAEMSDREICIAMMDVLAQEHRSREGEELQCYAQTAHLLLSFIESHTSNYPSSVMYEKYTGRLREVAAKQKNMMEEDDAAT